ncbi:YqaA family protein [Gilvimarinus chinensis]|uniref:YqaA family protein n=1 Tax=Gilvimarinus chinensis TaxID=396005 RepID=UPI00036AB92A|nr:VTT domain-containing protein [Gilvimarinus chinensis]
MISSIGADGAKHWFKKISQSKHMLWLIGFLSFLETIILPVPIELVLIPLMAANRDKLWKIALVTTLGCLLASLIGYGIGMAFFESLGRWVVENMGWEGAFKEFQDFFDQYGFGAVLIVGLVPIPFQVAMLSAGMAGYSIFLFVLAALIARGVRYFGLAWLVMKYGQKVQHMWQRNATKTGMVAGLVVVGLYAVMHYISVLIMG